MEHFVGHIGRELMNRLPDYFPEVPQSEGRPAYEDTMDALLSAFPGGVPDDPQMTPKLRKQLNRLLSKHGNVRQARAERDTAFLALSARGDIPVSAEDLDWLRAEWKKVHGVMVRAAHLRMPDADAPDPDELVAAYRRLEELLTSRLLEVPFHELDREAGELAQLPSPGPDDLRRARDLLREQIQPGFFAAATPAWLPLLDRAGMLARPPAPVRDGEWVRFPGWPAAEYLSRVAADRPADVLSIIDRLEETDNERVRSELVRALSNMPDEYASGNVERVARWLEMDSSHRFLLTSRAEAYFRQLIDRGRPEALSLFRSLLATRTTVRDYGEGTRPSARWLLVEHEPERMDTHQYERMLRLDVPSLAEHWPLQTAQMLVEQLLDANAQEAHEREIAPDKDRSSFWRQTIEPYPEQFGVGGIRDALVSAVRDVGERLVKQDPAAAQELLSLLAAQSNSIFTRLRLHLLRVGGHEQFGELRREAMVTRDFLESADEGHEYALLLEDAFAELSQPDRDRYLSWVDDWCDTAYFEQQYAEHNDGVPPPDDLKERWANQFRAQWLAPVKATLTPPWTERYQELVAEFGEVAHPHVARWRPRLPDSPRSAEALNEIPVADAVAYFSGAGAPGQLPALELEALLDAFGGAVEAEPARWAAEAERFTRDVAPEYVYHLLSGLARATHQHPSLPWAGVMALVSWVVASSSPSDETPAPAVAPGQEPEGMPLDRTRAVLARLLSDAPRDENFPVEHEHALWDALAALLQDASPTTGQDSHGDALTVAINSTRGLAMTGILRYARLKMYRLRTGDPAATLDALPEVRDLLEHRLDPRVEPSRAVRAVYVTGLRILASLDADWFASLLPRIFPADDDAWRSAWDTYITWSGYVEDIVILVADQYAKAVDQFLADEAATPSPTAALEPERLSPGRRNLAQHIYIAAWRRLPELAPAVAKYLASAPAVDRLAGVSSLGYALHGEEAGSPFREDLDALKRLWEARLAQLPDEDPELEGFGHWFASGCFNDATGLGLLNQTLLKTNGRVPDLYEFLGALADCAATEPELTYEALSIIGKEPDPELGMLSDRLEEALRRVLGGADASLREKVAALIDHLEWRGFRGLSRLLTAEDEAAPGTP